MARAFIAAWARRGGGGYRPARRAAQLDDDQILAARFVRRTGRLQGRCNVRSNTSVSLSGAQHLLVDKRNSSCSKLLGISCGNLS
jgi:hypothetical protein